MKPVGHKVLVLPIVETVIKGIIIPHSGQKKTKGKVVEIGSLVDYVKEGDEVFFHENSGIEIDYNGEKHIMLGCGPRNNELIVIL